MKLLVSEYFQSFGFVHTYILPHNKNPWKGPLVNLKKYINQKIYPVRRCELKWITIIGRIVKIEIFLELKRCEIS